MDSRYDNERKELDEKANSFIAQVSLGNLTTKISIARINGEPGFFTEKYFISATNSDRSEGLYLSAKTAKIFIDTLAKNDIPHLLILLKSDMGISALRMANLIEGTPPAPFPTMNLKIR